jgi:serine/threonine protein kinase
MTASASIPVRLGRYSVVQRLGAGGMAEVFLARSRGAEGTDKDVVVKRILPEFANNPAFRAMFIDEARVALRLNHPNVVQVYGFESDGPALLLVMEHVDGPDLGLLAGIAQRQGEPIPAPLVAYVVREVARGLHYAHERLDERGRPMEIVHRDVSPTNVLLSYDGSVKIGDFGIARARTASQPDDGAIKGKYAYMAPEQARGESVDRRADVWALGVVLSELLVGHGLFRGERGEEVLARVRRGDVGDLSALLAQAPEALRDVALRALRADRDARFASARELGAELGRYLHDLEQPADALALEQYLQRAVPVRRSLRPVGAPSSRPPPPAGAPQSDRPTVAAPAQGALTVPMVDARDNLTVPALPLPDMAAPRVPSLESFDAVRERVPVVVVAGRCTEVGGGGGRTARHFADIVGGVAFRAEATLEWSEEGSFTLVLGALRPQLDDPTRAAWVALDLLEAVRSLEADREETGAGARPQVALGLARGVAACVRDADGTLLRCEVVDDAEVAAQGLARSTRLGEARATLGLARILRRAFVFREGQDGRGLVLERPRTRSERDRWAEAQGWALAGRESVLAALREAVEGVRSRGLGQAVVVSGDPGVGKSAVLGAFAVGLGNDLRDATGVSVLRVEPQVGGESAPYGLIARVVRLCLDGAPREAGAEAPSLTVALEEAVLRWASSPAGQRAALRALRVCLGLEGDEPGAEAATTRELALVLRPMLSERAAARPLALLVDGVELGDAPSRALLADLVRRPPAAAVLTVVALRDDDPLRRELRGCPACDALPLEPLDLDARRRMIAAAFGVDDASDALVHEVSAVAGGHPWTILAVIDLLQERGRVRLEEQRGERREEVDAGSRVRRVELVEGEALVPSSLEEVIAARMESLSPEARKLLRWSALCADVLDAELLGLLGGPEGPRTRARLAAEGILVAVDPREPRGRWTFAHPAFARAALEAIDPTALPGMHARLAEIIERRGADDAPSRRALAWHREAAGAQRPAARAWLELGLATQATDPDVSYAAYGRSLALVGDGGDGEGLSLAAAAQEGREEIARARAHGPARREALLALRRVASASGDARWMARALVRQARYKLEVTAAAGIERDAVSAIRLARRARDLAAEAEARRVLAADLLRRGQVEQARRHADAALDALPRGAADAGTAGQRVEVLLVRSAALRLRGDLDAAQAARHRGLRGRAGAQPPTPPRRDLRRAGHALLRARALRRGGAVVWRQPHGRSRGRSARAPGRHARARCDAGGGAGAGAAGARQPAAGRGPVDGAAWRDGPGAGGGVRRAGRAARGALRAGGRGGRSGPRACGVGRGGDGPRALRRGARRRGASARAETLPRARAWRRRPQSASRGSAAGPWRRCGRGRWRQRRRRCRATARRRGGRSTGCLATRCCVAPRRGRGRSGSWRPARARCGPSARRSRPTRWRRGRGRSRARGQRCGWGDAAPQRRR